MKEAYFIFKGRKSSELGIAITFENLPPIEVAEDDIEIIEEVPGRDGYLTRDNNKRKPIIKTITCQLLKSEYKEGIKKWLQGKGELTLSNEDDVFFNALIVKPVQFYWNIFGGYDFDVEFICQPNAYLFEGRRVIHINKGNTTINNMGCHISKPYIKIYGDGKGDLIINNAISKYVVDKYIEIDSELMECYKDNNFKKFTGEFPLFLPGKILYPGLKI